MEEVGGEDEVVVEGCEEDSHDEHDGAETGVAEDGDFDKRRLAAASLEEALPEDESSNHEQRYNDEHRDPRSRPPDDVTLGQGEEEDEEANCDKESPYPINGSHRLLLPTLSIQSLGNNRRWRGDKKDACDRDSTSHDGRSTKDPFPTGVSRDQTRENVSKDTAQRSTSG